MADLPIDVAPLPAEPCAVTRAELKAERLKLGDPCPVCHRLVGHHGDGRPLPFAGFRSDQRVPSWDYPKVQGLVKDVRWLKADSSSHNPQTSRQFFSRLEVRLTQYADFKDSEWVKLLPSLIDDSDAAVWVLNEIVNSNPPLSWSAAMARFSQHFDTSDLTEQTRAQYTRCKMGLSESPQEFTTRFIRLCHLLNYHAGDGEARCVEDMIDRVVPQLKTQFKLMKETVSRSGNHEELAKLKTLHYAAESLISLGQTLSTPFQAPNRDRDHRESQSSRFNGKKRDRPLSVGKSCSFHPNSTNHSTDECKEFKRRRLESKNIDSRDRSRSIETRSSAKQNSGNNSKLTCYGCGKSGHIKPNCPNGNGEKSSAGPPGSKNSASSGKSNQQPGSARSSQSSGHTTASMEVHDSQKQSSDVDHSEDSEE